MVGGRTGGVPSQLENGVSGRLDPAHVRALGAAGRHRVRDEFLLTGCDTSGFGRSRRRSRSSRQQRKSASRQPGGSGAAYSNHKPPHRARRSVQR